MDTPDLLKLIALDADDLTVLSAHAQDAVVRVGDIAWRPAEQRFALVMRRFDWEGSSGGQMRRRLAGLHFARVTALKAHGVDPKAKDQVLNLLAITFEPGPKPEDEPGGCVYLAFSGGATLKLSVECIEAQLKDMGGMWETASKPTHE